ncbi:MAG: asparagine synthase (glutamine-hydrolyzing) [Pseudomonadota bacterium]
MCGIAGIYGINGQVVHRQEIVQLCDALYARGPDDAGYFVNNDIGLGMRRLSIIDVGGGQQPISNEDGSIKVVMNGEIYNFRTLRRELEQQGHQFRTHSDTEVIVHLYEEYGAGCVDKLRGMFAFAIWDENKQQLLIARDRLGIKPLYYGVIDGRLLFSSELKSLLALPGVPRELNWNSVGYLFAFLSTPRDESIIEGIHKLEPGCLLTVSRGQAPVISRYWDVEFIADHDRKEKDVIDQLRAMLEESVRLCMISDVPLGAFLSGGIDSSAVVATMARLSDRPVETFSIGFKDPNYNEAPYAREVATVFGTNHHEMILDPDVAGILEDLSWHLDEPLGDSSAIPTYMVSKLASQHVKVVLSGDGGDELFAGYDKYLVEQKERNYRYIPGMLRSVCGLVGSVMPEGMKGRRFLRHMALNGSERYLDATTMFGRADQRSLFRADIASHMLEQDPWRDMAQTLRSQKHWLSALQYLDIKHYLPLDVLTKVDRMSMGHSIEARVPLLDHKLVEFAATIPPHMKLHDGTTKHIFKQALRGILPDATLDRRKKGFAMPLGDWFRNEPRGYVQDLLLSARSRSRGIFNAPYIEKLLAIHQGGRALDLQLWTLISFELWCRRFLDVPATQASTTPRQPVRGASHFVPPHPNSPPSNSPPLSAVM